GYAAAGLSTLLSILFFEPIGSLALTYASDLIRVELYGVLAVACVFAFSSVADALITSRRINAALQRSDAKKSLLLRELVHFVANNFAIVTALVSMKSASVRDTAAKSALNDILDQVHVMARVHRRLRTRTHGISLDSKAFLNELCNDLQRMTRGR